MAIELDLNHPGFQADLFKLEKDEVVRFFNTLRKIRRLSWHQVYQAKGLNWEPAGMRLGPHGERLYSIRVSRKFRAVVFREGNFMAFVSLHPDHDSAYN